MDPSAGADFDTRLLDRQAIGVGTDTGRHQNLFTGQFPRSSGNLIPHDHHFAAVFAGPRGNRPVTGQHIDPAGAELPLQHVTDLFLFIHRQSGQHFDHCHLGAEGGENMRKFTADRATAENHE